LASIHGRFQPFHNGHLAYLRAALLRADHVYIGLTRVLTEEGIGGDVAPHRLQVESNPFTYFQRRGLIRAALDEADIDPARWTIGPFPIEAPGRLHEFWPLDLPCFTTHKDPWNAKKIEILEELGYPVAVLTVAPSPSIRSGTDIRAAIRAGDPAWRDWVPKGSLSLIEQWVSALSR
jgi:nicotinamide-nucleotide adenylyltransferase